MVTPEIPDDVRRAGERVRRAMLAAADTPDPQRYAAGVGAAAAELYDAAVLAGLLSLEPEPEPVRDVQAVIEASGYVRHGETLLGGSFAGCTCPKEACGGTAPDRYDDACPEHGGSQAPAQVWHWAAECPGQKCAECGGRYVTPRPGGSLPGYLVHAEACSQF